MKIYIVEPDVPRQRQLRTILSSIGHRSGDIESQTESKAALSELRKRRYDCVFIYNGEELDGLKILKDLRSGASSRNIAVVVYSLKTTKDSVMGAIQAGASTFLAYPFSVTDVEEALKKAQKKNNTT